MSNFQPSVTWSLILLTFGQVGGCFRDPNLTDFIAGHKVKDASDTDNII